MEKPVFTLDFEKPLRSLEAQIHTLRRTSDEHGFDVSTEITAIEERLEQTKRKIYSSLTPWQEVQLARHPQRPYSLDYIERIFTDFSELHGDRSFGDDQALIGGTAWFEGQPVMVIAQQKGRNTRENILRNFGMPHPEGYRKALRLMKLAEKFHLPVISFIDTKAAFAGIASEERHVSEAIARNLLEMSVLKTPILGIILGEGGSGGALGIAVVDQLLILEHAYYSVIPPEGCAAILWHSRNFTEQAAEALQMGAKSLREKGIVDGIINEPLGGAHTNYDQSASLVSDAIRTHLAILNKLSLETLLESRYQKFRAMGHWQELPLPRLEKA
jgi:acetyl-CoA carboxylase carboxyl transferase subunit alpha